MSLGKVIQELKDFANNVTSYYSVETNIKFMKCLLLLLTVLIVSSCVDSEYSLHKSIHITDKEDTIVTYGGTLYHYDCGVYQMRKAKE